MYENLRRSNSINKFHPAYPLLFDINLNLFAKKIKTSVTSLNSILNGKRKASERLNKDIMDLAIKINEERERFWNKNS